MALLYEFQRYQLQHYGSRVVNEHGHWPWQDAHKTCAKSGELGCERFVLCDDFFRQGIYCCGEAHRVRQLSSCLRSVDRKSINARTKLPQTSHDNLRDCAAIVRTFVDVQRFLTELKGERIADEVALPFYAEECTSTWPFVLLRTTTDVCEERSAVGRTSRAM